MMHNCDECPLAGDCDIEEVMRAVKANEDLETPDDIFRDTIEAMLKEATRGLKAGLYAGQHSIQILADLMLQIMTAGYLLGIERGKELANVSGGENQGSSTGSL